MAWYYAAFYDIVDKDVLRPYLKSVTWEAPVAEKSLAKNTKKKKVKAKDLAVEVPSVAMFQPTFSQYDISGRGKQRKHYFNEEAMEYRLSDMMQSMAGKADMRVEVVSGNSKPNLTTDDMNRYMILNDWFIERMNNDTNAMVLWNTQYSDSVMDDLGASHLGWAGYRYVAAKRPFSLGTMLLSLYLYPTFPFYIVWQLSKERQFSYAVVVFDTRTGQLSSFQRNSLVHNLSGDFINAQMYRILYHVKYGRNLK